MWSDFLLIGQERRKHGFRRSNFSIEHLYEKANHITMKSRVMNWSFMQWCVEYSSSEPTLFAQQDPNPRTSGGVMKGTN